MNILCRRLCLQCNKSVRRLEGFKVQFIQQKSKSGKYIEDPYVEKYMINYLQAISKENGKKFLDGLDSHLLERKRQLEVLYAIRVAEGIENTPSELSAHDWRVILTSVKTKEEFDRYLTKVFIRQKKRRLTVEARNEVYNKLRRPCDEEDLQIIQRIYFMKNHLSHWKGMHSLLHGRPVVLDMDYQSVDEDETFETARQIENMYNCNLEHRQPCHLHFTSFHRNEILVRMLEMKRNMFVDFHQESFHKVFPRDRLFYLVAEGPDILPEEIDDDTIFVLGGIGGTHVRKRSLKRAVSLGIPYGCLPADQFVRRKARSSRVFYLQTVLNIMLDKFAGDPWKLAFERHLPDDKYQKFPDLEKPLEDAKAIESYVQFQQLYKILDK
ncbi:tRNA methyltransferase 10 homolog C-like [Ruditapes philippinarum]|uniref:tRNA methyltransferase 10 homolog C-like n=1 Tax=Ruditapes philippinarum TaxID=129788 RepID=UPI00295AA3DF|nr:tRNA methyltransferase 10 homolog C-like [Ruditapes philippinarum]